MFSTTQNALSKSGKMAESISTKDWSKTSLGAIDTWPIGLRTTLGILLNAQFPMFLFWGKDLVCFYNDACQQSLGIDGSHSDFLGKSGAATFTKAWGIMLPIIEELIATGEASWYEDQWFPLLRDGRMENTYWTSSYSPIDDEFGKSEGVLVTLNEVTEKVESRKKREDAEERSRLATEITQIATWDLDLQTHEMIHSESLATIFGHQKTAALTHSEILGQHHPDDLMHIVEPAFELAMKTGVYKYEARFAKQNGALGWIRSHGKIFFDDHAEPLKILGTLIEITEERNHQEIIVASELKFRLLADSMPQLIWTADSLGNIDYGNLSVFVYTGLPAFPVDAASWLNLIHPKEIDKYKTHWAKAIESETDFLLEHRLLRHDGQYRWQLSRAIPQKDPFGTIQWVGTSTDIQQQKTFTEQLENEVNERAAELVIANKELQFQIQEKENRAAELIIANEELQFQNQEKENRAAELLIANKELESFTFISSHDLQEPLRKIQSFSNRILSDELQTLSTKGKYYFERIQFSALHMQTLINDLLAYSRTTETERKFENSDLNKIIREVMAALQEELQDKKATIEISNLCDAYIIPFQFRQLLQNLIANSLKFSRVGIEPHITITSAYIPYDSNAKDKFPRPIAYCHISVSDNGIGFDAAYKDKIFDIFQRLHDKENYEGTGIGLTIVRKIVENHNGFITATGVIGEGATFDIYIPAL